MYYVINDETMQIMDASFHEPDPQEMAQYFECDVHIIDGEHSGLSAVYQPPKVEAIEAATEAEFNHHCSGDLPSGGYGAAIEHCTSDGDTLWAGNDEYSSQVNFCPYCGAAAKRKVTNENTNRD